MIASLLLAACLTPPLFDMSGPLCLPNAEQVECQCSECMTWDESVGSDKYDVIRHNQDGSFGWIGAVYERPGFTDDDGNVIPPYFPRLWCVAWDLRTPIEGRLYWYEIVACAQSVSGYVCAGPSNPAYYRAAPYWCLDHEVGGRVVCPHS
jgi:hypothetical protein